MRKLIIFLKKFKTKLITKIVLKRARIKTKNKVLINNSSKLTKYTHLGNNVHFNGMEISGAGNVIIGDNFHSGSDCLIITSVHNFDQGTKLPYDETNISKDVVIGENVWLGKKVIILGGVTIGEGAIIQAGSCVVSNIPSCAIAGGHPAAVFKHRDMDHYNKLKSEGSFF